MMTWIFLVNDTIMLKPVYLWLNCAVKALDRYTKLKCLESGANDSFFCSMNSALWCAHLMAIDA